jgi:antimicrobial peptide system SdpB family protein
VLTGLARLARAYAGPSSVLTNVYGLARSLLALSLAATLACTHSAHLFVLAADRTRAPGCGPLGKTELFCGLPDHLELARWLAVALLLVVASGYRPRWTAPLHWWITFSYLNDGTLVEGGDQLAANLTLLLLPVALLDGRRWHWSAPLPVSEARNLIARSALDVIRLQVCIVYLHAAIGKVPVEEWHNGTALYYWLQDPAFGASSWLQPVVRWMVMSPIGVTLLTWGVIVLELWLAAGLVMPRSAWSRVRAAGVMLHLGIALVHGLVTFGIIMIAALVLYLTPMERPLRWPASLRACGAWLRGHGGMLRRDGVDALGVTRRTSS